MKMRGRIKDGFAATEGWYVGRLKEVPGVFSQGESLKELEDNIREAYSLCVLIRKQLGI